MSGLQVAMVGATGAVGGQALKALLRCDEVDRVTCIGRRTTTEHPRVVSRVADLGNDSAVGMALPDRVDVGISCLGTTIKAAGSKAAFRAIDLDAVVRFAAATRQRGATHFVLVTSMRAGPGAMGLYQRTKAEVEAAVSAMAFDGVSILRPSILDDEGARGSDRPAEKAVLTLMGGISAVIGKTHKWAPIRVSIVGGAIAALVVGGAPRGVVTYASDKLHQLGMQVFENKAFPGAAAKRFSWDRGVPQKGGRR